MNSVNRSNNATHKPRLIILEQNARGERNKNPLSGRFLQIEGASEHAETVAQNALIVNPHVQMTKINAKNAYYQFSPNPKTKSLKPLIQSDLRRWFKGHLKSLQEIAKDSHVKNTVVNISQAWNQFKQLQFVNENSEWFIHKMTEAEKKRLVSSTTKQTLNLSKLETFIDDAWNEMKVEIKGWQAEIKEVVTKLKAKNVVVVKGAGNDGGNGEYPGLNSSQFADIKSQFEDYEAIDPMVQGTGIIGVGSTKQNGDLEHYSTPGNHFQFATTVPDGADGTSLTTPAIGTGIATLLPKGYTVDQAVAHLRKIGIQKKDNEGNSYVYISLEQLQALQKLPQKKS